MRYAVIDLGTNTFHLLVVESSGYGKWETLVRHKIFVKLGEEGLRRIGNAAFKRGVDAIKTFKMQLDAVGIPSKNVRAYGTAALRMASNSDKLVQEIHQVTGITVNIISGMQEANLIYRGVRRAVPFPDNHVLIMDIGGGSVELIIADRNKVYWQGSYDVGVSLLFAHFHKSDPIDAPEILALEDFLEIALKDFWIELDKYHVPTIIGASVAFDIIENFMLDTTSKPKLYGYANISDFNNILEILIKTTLREREEMPELAPERIEMIVVALCLLRYIQKKGKFKEIYSSEYSLKEGMLEELM